MIRDYFCLTRLAVATVLTNWSAEAHACHHIYWLSVIDVETELEPLDHKFRSTRFLITTYLDHIYPQSQRRRQRISILHNVIKLIDERIIRWTLFKMSLAINACYTALSGSSSKPRPPILIQGYQSSLSLHPHFKNTQQVRHSIFHCQSESREVVAADK